MALSAEAEIRLGLARELIRAGYQPEVIAGQVRAVMRVFEGVELEESRDGEVAEYVQPFPERETAAE